MFTYLEVNNYFSIIFRGEYQRLENNGLRHQNTIAHAVVVLMIILLAH